jgi:hypothetical protein
MPSTDIYSELFTGSIGLVAFVVIAQLGPSFLALSFGDEGSKIAITGIIKLLFVFYTTNSYMQLA